MIRRNRDAKFIIYQVLYIFVITVLALKGAEINLGEVVERDNVVEKSVRDSLINIVDSLSMLGLKFNIEIDTNVAKENIVLKRKLKSLNKQVATLSTKVEATPKIKDKVLNHKLNADIPSPFSTTLTFLQFATNTVENKSEYPVDIIDPETSGLIISLAGKGSGSFELNNQNEVILKYGNKRERVVVKENLPPEIIIEKVTTKMDKSDIYVKELQRTTCFKIYIKDERLDQIRVNYSGPISVVGPKKDNKGNNVYSVSLKLTSNADRFDKWAEQNDYLVDSDDRYKTNFFFTALDLKSKQKVEVGESFYFTDFSK